MKTLKEKFGEFFFELIFSAFDCNVEVELNAEEYEFWWEKVMQVCDRVAEFSGAGWAQKGAQYSEARYGKRDMSYLFPYYEKAADMGWAEAEATVAYWRYMGFYCEQDKEEGERRFAALTSPEAILWGKHYRAFAEEFTGDKAKALQIRNELLAMPVCGLPPISWDITIRRRNGWICLRRLNGWKRACFIVNPTVRMNWH